jgi:hypothetical protein
MDPARLAPQPQRGAVNNAQNAETQLLFFVQLAFSRGQFFAKKTKICVIVVRMGEPSSPALSGIRRAKGEVPCSKWRKAARTE